MYMCMCNYSCMCIYVYVHCIVSMETVDADVEAIKQGLKSLLEEQELEPQNFILYVS